MKYELKPLPRDMSCPYCGTTVPRGMSVCTGCGAVHAIRRRMVFMGILFFILGLGVGHLVSSENMFLLALGIGVGGAFGMKKRDESRPIWML